MQNAAAGTIGLREPTRALAPPEQPQQL